MPGAWFSSRRPIRPATRRWCGWQPGGSESGLRRRLRRPRRACLSSARRCGSAIRWYARRPTGRRRFRTGRPCIARWPRSPTRRPILTAAPGTWLRPRRGRMRTSPGNWSARRAAARAQRDAGALDAALRLLVAVEAAPPDALQTADVEHLRGQIAFDQRRAGDAAQLLLSAARRLEPLNVGLARETHLEALGAARWAGDLGGRRGAREAR